MCQQDNNAILCRTSGCNKTYLTIGGKFLIPHLIHHLALYIKGYHICQLSTNDKPPVRKLQQRISLNFRHLLRLTMNLKVMSKSYKGHKFILCIKDKVTNYLITEPIYHSRLE